MSYFSSHRIRLVEFNVENLFVLLDMLDPHSKRVLQDLSENEWQRLSSSTTPNKPLRQVKELARAVLDMNPDFLMLCEVGGRESLANFSRHFLHDRYVPHLIEGNSNRGIDLGYLVKRDLPFTYDLISHKNRSIDFLYPHERLSQESGYTHLRSARKESHKFSRDVLELRVFENPDEPPVLITLLVHLKSQLDRDRIDPRGRDRRKAELEKLVKIYGEIRQEFGAQTPVCLAGDFNGLAARPPMNQPKSTQTDPEFEALYRDSDLEDVLEVADVAHEERFTHQQIYNNREGTHRQLDYIFIPKELQTRVNHDETWVYRFKDEHGMTQIIPRNFNEKKLLPSDHFPVILTLDPMRP
jgi:hypothetical protein